MSDYAHAKQFKRLRRTVKRQRTILGIVLREIHRKLTPATTESPAALARLTTLLERAERIQAYVLALCGALFLSGCASMYSETRNKQGTAVKDAWAKVDLSAQIAVPRKNRASILDEQLATEDSLAKVKRDGLIRGVVTAAPADGTTKAGDDSVAAQLAKLEMLVKASQVTGINVVGVSCRRHASQSTD